MGRVLAVIIWIITLLSVLLFVSGKWWFPAAISEHAPALDRQFMLTIVVVGIAFTAAQIGLGWMVWKYRDTGSKSEVVHEALPVDDPQVRQPDITRAQQVLNWEPKIELEEGLKRMLPSFGREPVIA